MIRPGDCIIECSSCKDVVVIGSVEVGLIQAYELDVVPRVVFVPPSLSLVRFLSLCIILAERNTLVVIRLSLKWFNLGSAHGSVTLSCASKD